jgi:tRNA-dihydrouridine synthase
MTSLSFHPDERPVIAQVFGKDLNKFRDVVPILRELGFDGFVSRASNLIPRMDINMGCPDKAVVAGGAGAGLIRSIDLAQKVLSSSILTNNLDNSNLCRCREWRIPSECQN